jgi:hypothetical protein
LALIGHVKADQKFGLGLPPEPQNSFLQTREEADNSAQENSKAIDGVSLNNENGVSTSWRAEQALWSEQNLPEILYSFDRPELWLAPEDLREPPLKTYQVNGSQLRDIPILPGHVSSDLEGWRHVAWTRMDPRISSKDIIDRVGTQPMSSASRRSEKQLRGQNSTFQMRTARFREDFQALGWVKKGGNFEKDRRKLKARLELAGVPSSRNTTRGVSWGLLDTTKGESGGRIPVPETKSWPSSVGEQPEVLPILPTSLPIAGTETLLAFTDHLSRASPQASSTRFDSPPSRAPTPEHYIKMSISNSFGHLTTKRASSSSIDIIMETPRKRRKTFKFEEVNSALIPISELSLCVPQPPVQVSDKDSHCAAYARSLELSNRFGTCLEMKPSQRQIPDDVLMSSLSTHPGTKTTTPRLASREAFASKLEYLTAHYAAKNATKVQLVQIEPTTYGNDEMITIKYGESTLTLKNYNQRCYLIEEDRTLLTTFHPAGSEERNRQLEYLLDPKRAPHGFQDCNGYEAPIAGVNLARELDYNIWYQVTPEEALGRIHASAVQTPDVQENNHMISPGFVMYFDGSMRSFDDLRGVPLARGEVGRARRLVNTMNTSNHGHFNAAGGFRT